MSHSLLKDFPSLLQPYSYKTLTYRYWGRDYYLVSSRELFSATQIDRGSQLLLASLLPGHLNVLQSLLHKALEAALPQLDIWDWGCGIGTLGLMAQGHLAQLIEKHNKLCATQGQVEQELRCELRIFDRDSLALAFAEANWQQNIGPQPGFSPSLHVVSGIWGEESLCPLDAREPNHSGALQLVLSNIPAKLGEPVLRQVLPSLATSTASYVAIVIVAPLRHLLEEASASGQIEILYRSGSGDHCVIHYRKIPTRNEERNCLPPALKLYKRGESCFALERKGSSFKMHKSRRPEGKDIQLLDKTSSQAKWLLRWPFRSAYGLPDFDQPSYRLELILRLLAQRNWGGRVLLWEAGHGHLACFLALKPGCHVQHIALAGRNRLGLLFAQYNLQNLQNRASPLPTCSIHSLPCLEAMHIQNWDLVVLPLTGKLSKSQAQVLHDWLEQLAPGTWLCLQGPASLQQFNQLCGWALLRTNGSNGAKAKLRGNGLLTQLWQKESH